MGNNLSLTVAIPALLILFADRLETKETGGVRISHTFGDLFGGRGDAAVGGSAKFRLQCFFNGF